MSLGSGVDLFLESIPAVSTEKYFVCNLMRNVCLYKPSLFSLDTLHKEVYSSLLLAYF